MNMPCKVALFEHIIVELVPVAQRREFRTWEFGKRTKVKTIDGQRYEIYGVGCQPIGYS